MPKLKLPGGRVVRERPKIALDRRECLGWWDWDANSDLIRSDTVAALLFGIDSEEADAGLPLSLLAARIHPADRPRVLTSFRRAAPDTGSASLEYRVGTADGGVRWMLSRGRFVYDHHGRPISGRGIIVDISDLQERGEDRAPGGIMEDVSESVLDQAASAAIAAFHVIGVLNDPSLTVRAEALLFEIGRKLALLEAAEERRRLN